MEIGQFHGLRVLYVLVAIALVLEVKSAAIFLLEGAIGLSILKGK